MSPLTIYGTSFESDTAADLALSQANWGRDIHDKLLEINSAEDVSGGGVDVEAGLIRCNSLP
jgi:hypothetical protein